MWFLSPDWALTDTPALFFFLNLSHQPRGLCEPPRVTSLSWLPISLRKLQNKKKTTFCWLLTQALLFTAFSLKSNLLTISDLPLSSFFSASVLAHLPSYKSHQSLGSIRFVSTSVSFHQKLFPQIFAWLIPSYGIIVWIPLQKDCFNLSVKISSSPQE